MADTIVENVSEVGEYDDAEAAGPEEVLPSNTHPASGADAAAFVQANNLTASAGEQEAASSTTPVVPQPVPGSKTSGVVPELVFVAFAPPPNDHPDNTNSRPRNVVATVNLDTKIDLQTVALRARNGEYNPKRFHAVIMRIRVPKATALIFQSGKMVVTGLKCEEDSRLASRKFGRMVQKLGFPARFTDYLVRNVVAKCDVGFSVDIKALSLHRDHIHFSRYEPELFPGVVYRIIKPKVVLLIFVNGKVVLTGARSRDDILQAFDSMYPVLQGEFPPGSV